MAALDIIIRRRRRGAGASTRRLGPLFWCAVVWMIFVFAAAALADVLPLPSPTDMDMLDGARRSALHWLGTDGLGRDELARLIYGARISLVVGFCAPIIGVMFGGALGMLAGYFRGRFEVLSVGSMDVLLAFPPLVLALAVTAFLGQSVFNLTCVLGVLGIPAFMRVARAATLTLARARIRGRRAGVGRLAMRASCCANCCRMCCCRCSPSSCSASPSPSSSKAR